MTQSGEGFEWQSPGYTAHFDDLPEGELTFTLSSDKNPKEPVFTGYFYPEVLLIGVILVIVIVGTMIVVVRKKKRGNK